MGTFNAPKNFDSGRDFIPAGPRCFGSPVRPLPASDSPSDCPAKATCSCTVTILHFTPGWDNSRTVPETPQLASRYPSTLGQLRQYTTFSHPSPSAFQLHFFASPFRHNFAHTRLTTPPPPPRISLCQGALSRPAASFPAFLRRAPFIHFKELVHEAYSHAAFLRFRLGAHFVRTERSRPGRRLRRLFSLLPNLFLFRRRRRSLWFSFVQTHSTRRRSQLLLHHSLYGRLHRYH